MRGVSMRPGSRVLTVTPSAATSLDRVLAQAATEARRVLDTPSTAEGSTTVMEATFRMRPHPASRIAGSTRSVRRNTDSTMDSKCSRQTEGSSPETPEGGGPPVLFSRISIDPPS